jgi:hypothetical protein
MMENLEAGSLYTKFIVVNYRFLFRPSAVLEAAEVGHSAAIRQRHLEHGFPCRCATEVGRRVPAQSHPDCRERAAIDAVRIAASASSAPGMRRPAGNGQSRSG